MPLYTVITQKTSLSTKTKQRIQDAVTRIRTVVMKVPSGVLRVVSLFSPAGLGYTAGVEAPTAALKSALRSGRTVDEKTDKLPQLSRMFQDVSRTATDQLAISLQKIPSSNAIKIGQALQAAGTH